MLSPQNPRCTFTDNDTWSHRIAGRYAGHDGGISDPQTSDTVYRKRVVYYRHRIAAHLCRTRLVPVTESTIPDKRFSGCSLQTSRHHCTLHQWPKWNGIAYCAAQIHGTNSGFEVVWR